MQYNCFSLWCHNSDLIIVLVKFIDANHWIRTIRLLSVFQSPPIRIERGEMILQVDWLWWNRRMRIRMKGDGVLKDISPIGVDRRTIRREKNMAFGNTGFSRCKMPLICIFSNIRLNNSKYVINTFFNCYRNFKSVMITRIFPISVYIWDFISSSLQFSEWPISTLTATFIVCDARSKKKEILLIYSLTDSK